MITLALLPPHRVVLPLRQLQHYLQGQCSFQFVTWTSNSITPLTMLLMHGVGIRFLGSYWPKDFRYAIYNCAFGAGAPPPLRPNLG